MTNPAQVSSVTAASGGRVTVTLGFRDARQSRAFYETLLAAQQEGRGVGLVVLTPKSVEDAADESQ
jgi:hypothetical protein